ncbi:MAG: site-specific integrase [Akkermansiaceae bacterium]|jgi:integrase
MGGDQVPSLLDKRGRRKYLNSKERKAFFRTIQNWPWPEFRIYCLVLFYTGCRPSEALNLRAENIDASNQTVTFATLKQRIQNGETPRYRTLPVPQSLIRELDAMNRQSQRSERDRVFAFSRATGWRHMKTVMESAGVKGIQATSKGLRHGFALACVSAGIPIETVRKFLGHRSLKNTMIYLDILGDEERQFLRKTWPKLK